MQNSHIKRKLDYNYNFYCSQKCETEKELNTIQIVIFVIRVLGE